MKVLLAKKDFPIDIVCSDLFSGKRHLFGTPNGLYQLDKSGRCMHLFNFVLFGLL